jgi:glycosyltransferase involved in cell wall biosynthesis
MKFSIIVATFNSALTIRSMLKSISNQTFIDFELIIVDNKSSDNTLQIVVEEFNEAKIISEPDTGIYNALNKGVALAKGDWIYILGSDDFLASSTVLEEVNYKILENQNLGLIYGDIEAKNYSGVRLINMYDPKRSKTNDLKCPPIFHQSAFVRHDVLRSLGQFPEFLDIHADYFILSGAFNCTDSMHIDTVICSYNQQGYSTNSFRNFPRSSRQLLAVNVLYGERLSVMMVVTLKNFARMVIDSTRQLLSRSK